MRATSNVIWMLMAVMLCQAARAQRSRPGHFRNEIIFITDNDNYTLQKRDGYYTNGFYLSLQQLSGRKSRRVLKTIMRYELGQMIYNPYKYSITDPAQMDRPFAGYLYIKATRSVFFNRGNNLRAGVSAGMLGKASGAQQTQQNYHKLIHIYAVEGWTHQLNNEPGVNLHVQYTHPLSGPLSAGQMVDLHAIGKGTLGTSFTNATAGLLFRIGFMEQSTQSVAWDSRLHGAAPAYRNPIEVFAFFQPEAMVQGYNATLQGGLFRKDKGPVTADLQPWLYQHRMGFMIGLRRFSTVIALVHRTREARQMRRKENYGSIQLSYRFR